MKKYNIAVCGAFNVYSYGDSLFPVALEEELRKRNILFQLKLFSPKVGGKSYYDGRIVYSYEQLFEENAKQRFDLVIIGGGELLHFKDIVFKDFNNNRLVYEAGEIWKKPIEFCQKERIACVVNGVGVPYDFSEQEAKCVRSYLERVSYISVRDIYSHKRLQHIGISHHLIPDTLWNINDYFKGGNYEKEKYIVVQYGARNQKKTLYDILESKFVQEGYKVVIIPVNYCHEDSSFTNDMYRHETKNITILDQRLSVKQIYDIISKSSLFIGTSLHGTLTAIASGVPAIIIDMYPEVVGKIDGFANWLDDQVAIISDVKSLEGIEASAICDDKLCEIKRKLQTHFDEIAKYLL